MEIDTRLATVITFYKFLRVKFKDRVGAGDVCPCNVSLSVPTRRLLMGSNRSRAVEIRNPSASRCWPYATENEKEDASR
jgi:hypothetical protein